MPLSQNRLREILDSVDFSEYPAWTFLQDLYFVNLTLLNAEEDYFILTVNEIYEAVKHVNFFFSFTGSLSIVRTDCNEFVKVVIRDQKKVRITKDYFIYDAVRYKHQFYHIGLEATNLYHIPGFGHHAS